jgi:FHA domain
MTVAYALNNMVPGELTEAAMNCPLPDFLALHGDTLFLLVLLGRSDTPLATGLGATATRSENVPLKPVMKSMSFRTHSLITPSNPSPPLAAPVRRGTEREIVALLEKDLCFALLLRKRGDAEAAYPDRISIGRAPNKDIVLRHPSVSKFHGWFEVDEEGKFYVTDATSRNSTCVNGRAIPPRQATAIEPGDALRFGSVDAYVCAPRTLWMALTHLSNRAR